MQYFGLSRSFVGIGAALVMAAMVTCGGSNPMEPSAQTAPYSQTDLVVGTGAEATPGRNLTVHYTGWLYDPSRPEQKGQQFDTSAGGSPFPFTLGAGTVIAGWDRGVAGMRVGGVRRLVIPAELAYGSSGFGSIPPNATLVFDVELIGVS